MPSLQFNDSHKIMARSIYAKQKKRGRGRPATGVRPMIGLRLDDETTAKIDQWAAKQELSRSEAIRRLIEQALAVNHRPAGGSRSDFAMHRSRTGKSRSPSRRSESDEAVSVPPAPYVAGEPAAHLSALFREECERKRSPRRTLPRPSAPREL